MADPGFSKEGAGVKHHSREDRGAEGVGFVEAVSPSSLGVGSGRTRKFLDFLSCNSVIWCILRCF